MSTVGGGVWNAKSGWRPYAHTPPGGNFMFETPAGGMPPLGGGSPTPTGPLGPSKMGNNFMFGTPAGGMPPLGGGSPTPTGPLGPSKMGNFNWGSPQGGGTMTKVMGSQAAPQGGWNSGGGQWNPQAPPTSGPGNPMFAKGGKEWGPLNQFTKNFGSMFKPGGGLDDWAKVQNAPGAGGSYNQLNQFVNTPYQTNWGDMHNRLADFNQAQGSQFGSALRQGAGQGRGLSLRDMAAMRGNFGRGTQFGNQALSGAFKNMDAQNQGWMAGQQEKVAGLLPNAARSLQQAANYNADRTMNARFQDQAMRDWVHKQSTGQLAGDELSNAYWR